MEAASDAFEIELDEQCDAFEAAWQRGESPSIEEYLLTDEAGRRQGLAELLGIELFWRRRRGEQPTIAEYQERFPQHAAALRREFTAGQETVALDEDSAATGANVGQRLAQDGSQFGNYDLLETIGQGGMGTVYRARQRNADRIVALKVVRPDLLAALPATTRDSVIERFNQEVQAAARMEDECIVRVYEVGEVDGQHFFSMRYVQGKSLSEMLRDGPLPPRRAAHYLEPIARALHKAHSVGILHRDLKPQNILVETETDRALVADFGLAKLGAENQELTRTGEVLGTPPYMSPEQAQDSGSVSASSDVYSLGATLYHLLTGRPPFQAATAVDTLRQVLDQDPVDPRRLNAVVDRDIDTICMKCLQKEPTRRYASALALAEDLRRYLNGEEIVARPIGNVGRLWRWARRHPKEATLTAATLLSLVLAIVFLVVGQVRTSAALQLAEENRRQAEENFEHARDAVDNFYTSVSEHTLLKQDGMQPLRADLLRKALEYDQQFLEERSDDPSQRRRVAASHFRVGQIVELIGSLEDALQSYEKALSVYQQLAAESAADEEVHEQLGDVYNAIGRASHRAGRFEEAKQAHQQASEVRNELAERDPSNFEYARCLANSHMNLGLLEKDLGNPQAAEEQLLLAQRIRTQLLKDSPDFADAHRDYGMGYFNLASLKLASPDADAAELHLIAAIDQFERLAELDPDDLENQWRLAICYRLRGDLKLQQRDIAAALEFYEQAGGFIERLSRANPDVPKYRAELVGLQLNLGQLHAARQMPQAAIDALTRAAELIGTLVQAHPEVARYRRDFSVTHLVLAQYQLAAEDHEAARNSIATARQRIDQLLQAFPADDELQRHARQIEQLAQRLGKKS